MRGAELYCHRHHGRTDRDGRFINLRIAPWARRLITRGLAIIPAIFVILLYGSGGVGELLILSQVVLSFQLPFAIVPLVMFTASRAKMANWSHPAG
nr:divalent metal cation transporter [Gemmobacter aquarius]